MQLETEVFFDYETPEASITSVRETLQHRLKQLQAEFKLSFSDHYISFSLA